MSESATLVAVRTKKHPRAMQIIQDYFLGSEQIAIILRVNEKIELEAWELFQKINKKRSKSVISFVDCTNIAFCHQYSIENILSYDPHFEGWVKRVF